MPVNDLASLVSGLPAHLSERCRVVKQSSQVEHGDCVVYWMCTAIRVDENPALDVARSIAHRSGLPLVVYQGLSQDYPFVSDRHHAFILQGARDVQRQFANEGITYALHLATRDDREPHLVHLAKRAVCIVTEEMPTDPPRRFLRALTRQTDASVLCVDTACVVPMQMAKRAYTRAFEFRKATERLYAARVHSEWPSCDLPTRPFDTATLTFTSLDLQCNATATLFDDLIAACDIDHSIGPIVDTLGGSVAGYARWEQFKASGLSRYAKARNNILVNGVSRMSPYLHYGMVSPMRLAREASAAKNAGAEKFLDELLIWRELAYVFCFYRRDHERWSALPEWARQTLEEHAADRRDKIYTWEQLARGQTDDLLWNAAQKSLLMQGELHNNVRMTWGKAILQWTASPQDALHTIVDLNHRYALDGRDPASYGGILWCLGQFDRPFKPEQPVIGTVRSRPTDVHSQRANPAEYMRRVAQPRFAPNPKVLVVGAGLSGLIAARTLADHGVRVSVVEKSRGVGGRMATRRVDDATSFDHGAQYFTARDVLFRRYVNSWSMQGLVAQWPNNCSGTESRIVVLRDGVIESESQSVQRFVAVPGMNAIGKYLESGLGVRFETQIAKLTPCEAGYRLEDEQGLPQGEYDRIVLAIPAEQAAELLRPFSSLADEVAAIRMNPCWAVLASFDRPITQAWAGAFLHDSFLSWAARNSTKPGRATPSEDVVIHANPEWTLQHLESDPLDVAENMLGEFWRVTGLEPRTPTRLQSHRWRYAIPAQACQQGCLIDETRTLIACGDWASGSRVEGAFLSGMAAAGRILRTLTSPAVSQAGTGQLDLF